LPDFVIRFPASGIVCTALAKGFAIVVTTSAVQQLLKLPSEVFRYNTVKFEFAVKKSI
jgi:hypothetical protein